MDEQLFKKIEMPSDEPVQFVGCYVLKWGKVDKPTVAFVETDEEYVSKEKIREVMKEIQTEIDGNPHYRLNDCKREHYRRLSDLL